MQSLEKMSIFSGNFRKKFDFLKKIFLMTSFSVYPDRIGYLQLLLGKLLYFSSKVTTFKHTSCTW